jgi:hypothetical protein
MPAPGAPTTVNKVAAILTAGTSALGNAGVQAVEALIVADFPILALPIVKPIWQYFFGIYASYFVKGIQNGETFLVIDVQGTFEKNKVAYAEVLLANAKKANDPVLLLAAEQTFANAISSVTRDDGSNPSTG